MYAHFPGDLIYLASTFPLIPYHMCKAHFLCDCNRAIDVQVQSHSTLLIEQVGYSAPKLSGCARAFSPAPLGVRYEDKASQVTKV